MTARWSLVTEHPWRDGPIHPAVCGKPEQRFPTVLKPYAAHSAVSNGRYLRSFVPQWRGCMVGIKGHKPDVFWRVSEPNLWLHDGAAMTASGFGDDGDSR